MTMASHTSVTPRLLEGRLGLITGPVVFLASDMSRYATDITLAVDGGFLAV